MTYDAGDYPRCLYLETSVKCNARCVICPSQYLKRPDMTLETALSVIRQFEGRRLDELHPFQYADPLVWPHLLPFLQEARRLLPNTRLILYTNGALMTSEMTGSLLALPVHYVTFSIDGASKEVYEEHRPGLHYETVVENVKRFLEANSRSDTPAFTRLHFTFTQRNYHEIPLFREQWTGLCSEVTFHECDSRLERMVERGHPGEKRYYTQSRPTEPCAQPFNGLFVFCNGEVGMCCIDYEPETSLGNINEQSIEEIWNGPTATNVRCLHNAGRKTEINLCAHCSVSM